MSQSACVGGTVNFTCVVMFTSSTPRAASWITENGNSDAITLPGHTRTDDSNGRSSPANVTTVLIITDVSISDNGADYICVQGFNVRSDTVFLTVFGEFSIHYLNLFTLLLIYMYSYVRIIMCSYIHIILHT